MLHRLRRRSLLASTVILFSASFACAQQADFGINAPGDNYWNTAEAWANIVNNFSSWGTFNQAWVADPGLTFTADGYPLESASIISEMYDYPNGEYQVSYTGDATMSVWGCGTLTDVVTVGNTTTADLTVTQNGDLLQLNVGNINPVDPMDNLQIMTPGTHPGQVFTSAFLSKFAPVSTIRFMNWTATNGNPDVNWSDRTTPQDVIQTSAHGVALENEIALCNQTGKNGWFNIPVGATDAYITSMADLLHSTMSPDETIYIEYSNELWNTSFPQFATNFANAAANPLLAGITNTEQLANDEDAYRTMQISQIFQQEFGADRSRVKIVLATQCAQDYYANLALQFLQTNLGDPSNYISDLAIAPYASITGTENVAGLTLDQLFSDMFQDVTSLTQNIQQYAKLASQYHLTLTAYEGGQGLTSAYTSTGGYVNQTVMEQAQSDPRMGQVIADLLNAWTASGGQLFNYFDLVGGDANSGFWGLLQNINQTGSVKWDAMLRTMLPLGDVNGDGVVNAADLAIINTDMGQSNMWYQQGDLNGDNLVNADDLTLFFLGYATQQENARATLPEPVTHLALLSVAGFLGFRRRHRAA